MLAMWRLGGLTWLQLANRIWTEITEDDVFGRAAQLAYYLLLALFPLLIFLISAIGLIMGSGSGMRHALLNYLGQVMPGSAFQLVDSTIGEITGASGAGKLSFGLLAALWAASNGMGAITQALNAAYDVNETRAWWKQHATAIVLTLALSILIITALFLVLLGTKGAESLVLHYQLSWHFLLAWKVVQWPIVLAFMLLAFSLIYYFAPDVHDQSWKWLTPGSAIGVTLWLMVSSAFKIYLHFFDSYSKTYGSLGAVIVLMLWLYLTGAAILIGGEVNSEIENASARTRAPDAKDEGAKTPSTSRDQERAA